MCVQVSSQAVHALQQDAGHPLETVGQRGQARDGPTHSAVDDEQYGGHCLQQLEPALELPQTHLICHQRL